MIIIVFLKENNRGGEPQRTDLCCRYTDSSRGQLKLLFSAAKIVSNCCKSEILFTQTEGGENLSGFAGWSVGFARGV